MSIPTRVFASCFAAALAVGVPVSAAAEDGGKGFQQGFRLTPYVPITLTRPLGEQDWRFNVGLGLKGVWGYQLNAPVGLTGDIHASAAGLFYEQQGWEFATGAVIGPRFASPAGVIAFSILSGAEFRGDQYWLDGDEIAPMAWMGGLPMLAKLEIAVVDILGGVIPWWYLDSGGRPGADYANFEIPGFGDEFEIVGLVGVDLGILYLGVHSNTRLTGYNTNTTVGIALSFRFRGPR